MATRTHLWLLLVLLGALRLGVACGPLVALEALLVYAALLAAGILFVRIVLARRRYL